MSAIVVVVPTFSGWRGDDSGEIYANEMSKALQPSDERLERVSLRPRHDNGKWALYSASLLLLNYIRSFPPMIIIEGKKRLRGEIHLTCFSVLILLLCFLLT